MTDKIFLDTNLWVYFYARTSPDKRQRVEDIILAPQVQVYVSTQVLGELFNVLVKKKFTSQAEAIEIVEDLINSLFVIGIEIPQVSRALEIKVRYGYSYWDSLVLATAILEECSILYSEDMQHHQWIDQTLRIVNPFV